jgi:hypothetical protein
MSLLSAGSISLDSTFKTPILSVYSSVCASADGSWRIGGVGEGGGVDEGYMISDLPLSSCEEVGRVCCQFRDRIPIYADLNLQSLLSR